MRNRKIIYGFIAGGLFLVMLAVHTAANAAVIRVHPNGNDANSGVSWAEAKKTIQAAINAANQGDEIWVAAGTYQEHIKNKTVGPSGAEVAVDTALYGGFAGTETNRNERNYDVYFTILDGTNSGAVLTITAGAGLETRVDGFYITRGTAGISCSMSSPTITNNFVYSNSSSGIYIGNYKFTSSTDYVFPVISHNTIIYNTASYGGGIHIYGARGLVSMPSSAPQITNNTIGWNTASSTGGGIGSYGHSSPYIADNTIFANSAAAGDDFTGGGGGIFATALSEGNEHVDFAVSAPKIINNIITANAGGQLTNGVHTGGGIHVKETDIGVPFIANNSIVANHGAGIWFSTSFGNYAPNIQNNLVAFNTWGLEQLGDTYSPIIKNNCVYGNVLQGKDTNYQGIANQTGLNGNISADPKLENYPFGQIHLQPDSPCIDAGSDDIVEEAWQDIDGQARIQGGAVDIGADESNGSAWNFSPPIIYVRPGGNDSADGLTWGTAKKTVQAGINSAMATSGEVWVAAGTYTEHIFVPAFVYLYGGFSGTESSRGARDVVKNITILDGGGVHGVVRSRNAGFLVSAVDGFTIQNGGVYTGGDLQQMYGPGGLGGGININVASPYIANNTIRRNSLAYDNTPGAQSLGGGIYAWVSYAEISGNTITENEILNYGSGLGGGIYCSHSLPVIRDNRITQNRAKNGSAIYCDSSSPSIKNNTIENNSFYNIGFPPYSGAASGAIYLWLGDSFLIEGNLIRGNLAIASGGLGAGITVSSNYAGRIQNNLIVNNTANGSGGGIYAIVPVEARESLYIVNNTIVGNTGASYAEFGGGLALNILAPITTPPEPIPNRVMLANNIIAYNSSGIYLPPSGVVPPTMANNDVYPLNASSYINLLANPTDIHVDPQFVDRPGGDFHLVSSSPCIDAGENGVSGLPLTDIEGRKRIQDGNDDGVSIVDMGAYEAGDSDGDGISDSWEMLYFGNLSKDGSQDSDADGLTDYSEFLSKTNPTLKDTDGDGLADGWEVQYSLDPLVNDASGDLDGDGETNLSEYNNGTDPTDRLSALRGDVTGDKRIDLMDAITALRLLTGLDTGATNVINSADVNGDGKIGNEEIIWLFQRISGLR
jgi:hypothetical protein